MFFEPSWAFQVPPAHLPAHLAVPDMAMHTPGASLGSCPISLVPHVLRHSASMAQSVPAAEQLGQQGGGAAMGHFWALFRAPFPGSSARAQSHLWT